MSVKIMGKVYDLALPRSQKQVLLALADHADHDGLNAYPGVPLLAYKTGFSERQVQRCLAELLKAGIICAEEGAAGGRGIRTIYSIHVEKGDILPPFNKRVTKGDKTTLFNDKKGDIDDTKRVTLTTRKGDIDDTHPSLYESSVEPSIEPSGARAPATAAADNKFVAPTLEECVAYFHERGWQKSWAKQFWGYWETWNWKSDRRQMKNWKAAAFKWAEKEIDTAPKKTPATLNDSYQETLRQLEDD